MSRAGKPPAAPSADARARLSMQSRRDTKPELAIRSALHALGLRYRVDRSPIAGMRSRADLVFSRARVVVFVDGCFWHGCPEHGTIPLSNREWWISKIEANRKRDERVDRELTDAGWRVVRCWEHDDPVRVAHRVERLVRR